jgi:H+/Cl- antiporter ClcA
MVAVVISAGWAIALITLLAVRGDLPASDRWWIWTCVTGLGLGLFGMVYVPYLKRSRARAARRRAAARTGADSTGADSTGADSTKSAAQP